MAVKEQWKINFWFGEERKVIGYVNLRDNYTIHFRFVHWNLQQ